jgi:hypothetical protein
MAAVSSDTAEENAGVPQIEVTPEMIEAGLKAMFPAEVQAYIDERELVARIYRCMELARRRPS